LSLHASVSIADMAAATLHPAHMVSPRSHDACDTSTRFFVLTIVFVLTTSAPDGTSPVSRYFHIAINSFRA
jgi:hypothetical protein